jgi:hypothetical protein
MVDRIHKGWFSEINEFWSGVCLCLWCVFFVFPTPLVSFRVLRFHEIATKNSEAICSIAIFWRFFSFLNSLANLKIQKTTNLQQVLKATFTLSIYSLGQALSLQVESILYQGRSQFQVSILLCSLAVTFSLFRA